MSHRPYPNVDRALRQMARRPTPDLEVPPALRPFIEGMRQIRENARLAVEAWPADEYHLSTRPGVVSGES
jgi:hypothetical protein